MSTPKEQYDASVTPVDQQLSAPDSGQLASARLYLCTDARKERGDFVPFLREAFAGGVDIIQLRDKSIEAAEELELLAQLRSVAAEFGALWSVNNRADVAKLAGTPVLHLGQKDLPVPAARTLLDSTVLLGMSTHTAQQASAAAKDPMIDYFCAGPLWATPTKPGRPGVGLEVLTTAAKVAGNKPWFAIGGIDLNNVDSVLAAGANRIVVVRAITEAADPRQAAKDFKSRLLAAS